MVPTKSFLGYEVQKDDHSCFYNLIFVNVSFSFTMMTGESVREVPNGGVRHLLHGRLGASRHVHVAYSRRAYDQGFILRFHFYRTQVRSLATLVKDSLTD